MVFWNKSQKLKKWVYSLAIFCLFLFSCTFLYMNYFADFNDEDHPITIMHTANTQGINLHFTLQKGWHVYSDKQCDFGLPLSIQIEESSNVQKAEVIFPQSKVASIVLDAKSQSLCTFEHDFDVMINIVPHDIERKVQLSLVIDYSACKGFCIAKQETIVFHDYLSNSVGDNTQSDFHWLYILLLSFLGGVILNFMPCVLPVLSIKILHFMKTKNAVAKEEKMVAIFNIMGIVTAFLCLAAVVCFFKKTGAVVGWGMHFQEPYFIMAIIFIISFLSLNALEKHPIHFYFYDQLLAKVAKFSDSKIRNVGSFFSGILTTLLATSCVAPLISTSVAYALTQKTYMIFIIYCTIGLGMSIPYVMMLLLPNMLRFIPKSGSWLVRFKRCIAALLLITVMWLLHVLYIQVSILQFTVFCSVLVLLKFLLFKSFENKHHKYIAIAILFVIIAIVLLILILPAFTNEDSISTKKSVSTATEIEWISYDTQSLKNYIDDNKIVFLDVTAFWCVNCQYNKHFVLNTEPILKIFQEYQVVRMRADHTKKSDAVDALLKQHNKFGIPLNIIYCPGNKKGIVLPEMLNYKIVKKALQQCLAR